MSFISLFRGSAIKLSISIFLFLFVSVCFSYAVESETVTRVRDDSRVLSVPFELHLTASDSAIINSTISLNHKDAWLFFDNVKPSTVISKYVSAVEIDGASFQKGVNGRVAIYGNGAVLMPHGVSFKPLTVYTEPNFKGDSISYGLNTLYNNLGDFANRIQSIKLKRGYQLALATGTDGTGYSRIFIADQNDIEIELLQPELKATVNFIRVLKHQWVSKKGKAGWDPNILDGTTYYDWNIGGNSSNDVEYAAIRQNGGWPSWDAINSKENITHLLGFNEPDRPDQSDMTMATMIAQWPSFMKSGLRVGSPAWSSEYNSVRDGGNLFDFIDQCDALNYRVDFVALHCYWVKSPQQWYNDLKYVHDRTGRPLWITEWNNGANWTTENWPAGNRAYNDANALKQLNDIKGILEVLDTASFIERYFIYDWVEDCRAMVLDNKLTLAGEYYANNKSQIGYNSKNDVVLGKISYKKPEASYRYLTRSKLMRIGWTNPNEGLAKSFRVERKVNKGAYEVVDELEDISELVYLEALDSTISGRVTYRIGTKTIYNNFIYSNEVSFYQSKGSRSLQVGNFPINSTDWSSCLYSSELDYKPVVLSGIPTFNNITALTHRVNAINETSFKIAYKFWNYQSSSVIKKDDYIGVMALDSGLFDFGGLKAEIKTLSGVNDTWVNVEFKQQFDVVPAVFANQVSNSGSIPTIVSIRNVTKYGFELKLSVEEALSASNVWSEKVNFMAIEPGKGVIHDKRITVGHTKADEGVSSSGFKINIPQHYGDPVLFAKMQSKNDKFSSVLRYFDTSTTEFNVFKQREMSESVGNVAVDKMAWMVLDISENQALAKHQLSSNNEVLQFYPNPTAGQLFFNFNEEKVVEIYSLTGSLQKREIVKNQMNISDLRAGNYILRVENEYKKLIKK